MTDTMQFQDTDLVYVDPDTKRVVGLVEWKPNGDVKSLERPYVERKPAVEEEGKPARPMRRPKKRYYPWCTYRTAKRVYHVDGKFKEAEAHRTLDDVIERALKEPYWDS